MRTSIAPNWGAVLHALYGVLIGIAAFSGAAKTARAQLYVSQPGILTVSEYNASTGDVINARLISQLSAPNGLAVEGNILYVANEDGTIGKYDATTGEAINANFITGLQFTAGLAVKSGK
jgi:hypothetical protein